MQGSSSINDVGLAPQDMNLWLLGKATVDEFGPPPPRIHGTFHSAMGQALVGMSHKSEPGDNIPGAITMPDVQKDFERPHGQEQLCKNTFFLTDISNPLPLKPISPKLSNSTLGAKRGAPTKVPTFAQVQRCKTGASPSHTSRAVKHREDEQRRRDKLSEKYVEV
jgi:hypothetical protein